MFLPLYTEVICAFFYTFICFNEIIHINLALRPSISNDVWLPTAISVVNQPNIQCYFYNSSVTTFFQNVRTKNDFGQLLPSIAKLSELVMV